MSDGSSRHGLRRKISCELSVETLGARVGKLLSKCKMGKFIKWSIKADAVNVKSRSHKLIWEYDQEKITKEKQLDGCYVIRTDAPKETLGGEAVVDAYKSSGNVERAFCNLKTIQLEILIFKIVPLNIG